MTVLMTWTAKWTNGEDGIQGQVFESAMSTSIYDARWVIFILTLLLFQISLVSKFLNPTLFWFIDLMDCLIIKDTRQDAWMLNSTKFLFNGKELFNITNGHTFIRRRNIYLTEILIDGQFRYSLYG